MGRIVTAVKSVKAQHLIYLIIILVGVALTLIWFRKGLLIATGESGDLLINPDRWLESLRYLWQETYGTGISVPSYYPMIPFYVAISFLKNLKLSIVFIQGLIFGFLLISGAVFMCLLTNSLTSKNSQTPLVGLIAGLFYMLNPYTMVLVWNRFLYSQMFIYASLPLLLLLFIVGLEKQKISYAGAAAIVSVAFSVAYMHPASIVVQWAVLLSYLLFYLLMNRRDKAKVTHALKLSGTFALLWGLFNAWWILPFAKVAPGFFGSGYFASASENIGSLKAVSKYTNLYYVSRLLEANAMFESRLWGDIYSSIPFEIISWLSPAIVLLGIVLAFRNRYTWYFVCLSVVALLLAKGATPPWKNFLPDLLKLLPISGVFRNPFEKTGIIIAMGYAFLFGTGLTALMLLFKKRLKILGIMIFALITFVVLVVYPWPMWTGEVFGGGTTSVFVTVPEYYARADNWIARDKDHFRILHLPLAPSEGIVYNWPHGYNGYELNHVFFKKASISGTQWVPFANELYHQIARQLYTNQLWKMMALFNAKYVVVHNDIDYEASERDSPQQTKQALKYRQELEKDRQVSLLQSEGSEESAWWELFWADRERTHMAQDLSDRVGQSPSFVLDGYPDKGKHLGVIYYVSPNKQDLSDKAFLSMWVKSNVPVKFFFGITDEWGRGMTWEGSKNPNYSIDKPEVGKWRHFALSLARPTAKSDSSLDYRGMKIAQIFIGSDTLERNKRVILKIGAISVAPGKLVPVEGIRYKRTFGSLDLYKLQENRFLKHIYATNQFVFSEDSSSLFDDIEKDSFVPGDEVIFLRSQLVTKYVEELKKLRSKYVYKPKIVFRKINPAKYVVEVKNASKPFFLVFSETYNPDWKAYIDGKVTDSHFMANGYANAYYIDKTGSFRITIKYTPYILLVVGFWVSVSAFVLSFLVLLLATRGERLLHSR